MILFLCYCLSRFLKHWAPDLVCFSSFIVKTIIMLLPFTPQSLVALLHFLFQVSDPFALWNFSVSHRFQGQLQSFCLFFSVLIRAFFFQTCFLGFLVWIKPLHFNLINFSYFLLSPEVSFFPLFSYFLSYLSIFVCVFFYCSLYSCCSSVNHPFSNLRFN